MTDYQLRDLAAFRRFVDHLKQRGIAERKWPDAAAASFEDIGSHSWEARLWEGIVATNASELGFTTARLPGKKKRNVDFVLSKKNLRLYAECVVPQGGEEGLPSSVHSFRDEDFKAAPIEVNGQKWTFSEAEHLSNVADDADKIGLRLSNALYVDKNGKGGKNKQIEDCFEEGAPPGPAIVFLNSTHIPHLRPISAIGALFPLSPVVSSLFGTDGVPTFRINLSTGKNMGQVLRQSPGIKKGDAVDLINRNRFSDGTLPHISAVVHVAQRSPIDMVLSNCNSEYSFAGDFSESAELILNPTANYPLTDGIVDMLRCHVVVKRTTAGDGLEVTRRSDTQRASDL